MSYAQPTTVPGDITIIRSTQRDTKHRKIPDYNWDHATATGHVRYVINPYYIPPHKRAYNAAIKVAHKLMGRSSTIKEGGNQKVTKRGSKRRYNKTKRHIRK